MRTTAKFLSLAALAATTVFTSCKKDSTTTNTTAVTTWSAKILGAQTNAAGSFFSPNTGVVYATQDSGTFIANKVDLSFAQIGSDTTKPKFIDLSSRRSQGLSKVTNQSRSTIFQLTSLSKAQFDTTSGNYIDGLTVSGTGVINVAQGKVYSFSNADDQAGLIYISNISAPTAVNGTNGSATIEVRFVK